MATEKTTTTSTARARKKEEPRITVDEFVLELRQEAPEFFGPQEYDQEGITNALVEKFFSIRNVSQRTALLMELFGRFVSQRHRTYVLPGEAVVTPSPRSVPEAKAVVHKAFLSRITLDSKFGDKKLRDHTLGELRALNSLFTAIIKLAGRGSDDRKVGDCVTNEQLAALRNPN